MKRLLPIAMMLACPMGATATDWSLQAGVSDSRQTDPAPTVWAQATFEERGQGGRFSWQPVASVGVIGGRGDAAHDDTVFLLGGGGRLHFSKEQGGQSPIFLEAQVMAAGGRTEAISGPVQFATAMGWRRNRWEVILRHVSNGGLEGPNRGETMVLVGRRF